jgi:hypothetical protein
LRDTRVSTDGEKVRFRDAIRRIRITEFGSYEYCKSFDDSPWKKVIISKPGSRVTENDIEMLPISTLARPKLTDINKQLLIEIILFILDCNRMATVI